jgi:predicted glutamine amidotransferase
MEAAMCRWIAYSGSPIALDEVLFKPSYSLVVQSLKSRKGLEATNGDGFGVGWYGKRPEPSLYRSTAPAWNDRNLRELSAQIESPLFLAHVRSSTGTAVQQTNCHPFRHGPWLFMHNGLINGFARMKRELAVAVDEALYPCIEGTTDSEMMFFLALTFGLDADPPAAVARMVGHFERLAKAKGIENAMQMTLAVSNGKRLWVFRYSSEGQSRSLFQSTDIRTLRKLYPDVPAFKSVSEETRLVVSEPFVDLPGAWNEVEESTWGVIENGVSRFKPFAPASA